MTKPKARPNGDGSVYYVPSKQRYIAALVINGKPVTRLAAKKSEANALLRELKAQRDKGINIASGRQKLKDFLELWLTEWRHRVKPDTLRSYRNVVRLYITPVLGDIALDKLTPIHCEQWINGLADRRLKGNTQRNPYMRLNTALRWAVDCVVLAKIPLDRVKLPSNDDAKQPNPLDQIEAERFIAAIEGHRLEGVFYVAVRLGLRRGELLGLRWEDLDWQKRTIAVTGQVRQGATRDATTKTKASRRTLPLDQALIDALFTHRNAQIVEKRDRDDWKEQGLIFPSEVGTPLGVRSFDRQYKAVLAKANITARRLHDLRHTFASLSLANDANLGDVSAIMGHTDQTTTARIYAKSYDAGQKKVIETMGKLLPRQKRGTS